MSSLLVEFMSVQFMTTSKMFSSQTQPSPVLPYCQNPDHCHSNILTPTERVPLLELVLDLVHKGSCVGLELLQPQPRALLVLVPAGREDAVRDAQQSRPKEQARDSEGCAGGQVHLQDHLYVGQEG